MVSGIKLQQLVGCRNAWAVGRDDAGAQTAVASRAPRYPARSGACHAAGRRCEVPDTPAAKACNGSSTCE